MEQKNALLTFPRSLIEQPVISTLIRQIGVEVNILRASITPESDGRMFVILGGESDAITRALEYLNEVGIRVVLPARNLVWDDQRCTHCGACVGQCPSQALSVHPETRLVQFDAQRCIACELCIPACGYGALQPIAAL